jgi:hypothetical protein
MGGQITVAIRRSNGDEVLLDKWTNEIPYIITKPLFLQEGEILEDYIKSGPTISEIDLDGYGILAIDFVTKKIRNYQGYCTVPHAYYIQYSLKDAKHILEVFESGLMTIESKPWAPFLKKSPKTIIKELKEFVETGVEPKTPLMFEAWLNCPDWEIINVNDCGNEERVALKTFFEENNWKTKIPESQLIRDVWYNEDEDDNFEEE